MLLLVVGPSGSGKTTFIRFALKHLSNAKVICIDVYSPYSRVYETNLGKRSVTFETFNENQQNGAYSIINTYDNCKYGYSIPTECNKSEIFYILDYPGEYPECIELTSYNWFGIMVLPPSIQVLKERLFKTNRNNRIESAIDEYKECLSDIESDKITGNWLILYNSKIKEIIDTINEIKNST
jgi:guanylate kinase